MAFPRTSRRPVLLLVLIAMLILAACGSDDDDPTATSAAADSTATTATGDPTATTGSGDPTATGAEPATTMTEASGEATATDGAGGEATPTSGGGDDEEVTLRLGVSMTPQELEDFERGLDVIREAHPNWTIELEQTPQDGITAKINSQIAAEDLPDVQQVQGLFAQPWIRQGAFLDLTEFAAGQEFAVDDFWGGALEQFTYDGQLYAIPNTVAPDFVYFNLAMFEAAGLELPGDDWAYEELRELALQLTLDSSGRNATDSEFDPDSVVQWGLNVTPPNIWSNSYLAPWGGDTCANEECTEVQFSSPEIIEALEWWASLSSEDYAAPYDPYSGNQTGVPGDPFAAGLAAMGFNGYFLVGQLNATGEIEYDVRQPPAGPTGERAAALSTNGWTIAANSEHPDAAWQLIQELTSEAFLTEFWAQPGHGIPARQSVANAILNSNAPPTSQQAILDTLEYAEVFYPNTAGAFEAFSQTLEFFTAMMQGTISVEEGAAQIDEIANEILARDQTE
jgi:multiple sugar transport system substrate-binding protein